MNTQQDVDLNGEAVRDMDPTELEGAPFRSGSEFLKRLQYRRGWGTQPVYTIYGEEPSEAFRMLTNGWARYAEEPSDGIVPVQSQRGYPFQRDINTGEYLPGLDGRIATQDRMFPNPGDIEKSQFLPLPHFVVHSSKFIKHWSCVHHTGIDTGSVKNEVKIGASHSGLEGAPFVAAGLVRGKKSFAQRNPNYILKYLDYQIPELSAIDSYWNISPTVSFPYLGMSREWLMGLKSEYLPATSKFFYYFPSYYLSPPYGVWALLGDEQIRPFENQDPLPAGGRFISRVLYGRPRPYWEGGGEPIVRVINPGGVMSNTIEFKWIGIAPESKWYTWWMRNRNTGESENIFSYDGHPFISKWDKLKCVIKNGYIQCEDGKDGEIDKGQTLYLQFRIPEKYIGRLIRSIVVLVSGSPSGSPVMSYSFEPISSSITWDNPLTSDPLKGLIFNLPFIFPIYGAMEYCVIDKNDSAFENITQHLSQGDPFTIIVRPPENIPDSSDSVTSFFQWLSIEFEPREFVEEA